MNVTNLTWPTMNTIREFINKFFYFSAHLHITRKYRDNWPDGLEVYKLISFNIQEISNNS